MFNWLPIIIFIGFVAGLGAGHEYAEKKIKKIVPIVKFVSDEKKRDVLSELDITIDENTKCHVCEDNITLENLGIVIQRPSGPVFICSKTSCITTSNMIGLQQEK